MVRGTLHVLPEGNFDEDTLQTIAVDAFLEGCTEKRAAFSASQKNPKRISQAVRFVKASIQNLRYLGKSTLASRLVSLQLDTVETVSDEVSVRCVSQAGKSRSTSPDSFREDLAKEIKPEHGSRVCGKGDWRKSCGRTCSSSRTSSSSSSD